MARMLTSFDGFVAAHADGLLRTAYLITADKGEAEDLVQECLLLVERRWRRISVMDQPSAYARRVLIRLALRASRQSQRRRAELGSDIAEPVESSAAIELVGVRDAVRTALGQLTERQRSMLVLRYFHDLTEAQTAEVLGCTVGTVKSTTSRSLSQLRGLMEPERLAARSSRQ
jgi:RNA polymerase sigma-70 factor (sigma-E family)